MISINIVTKCFIRRLFQACRYHRSTKEVNGTQHLTNIWTSNSTAFDLIQENFVLHENFVTENEEKNLLAEIDPIFKRRRYQFDHWDGAIQGYKETEKEIWNEENSQVIKRLRELAFPSETAPLRSIHVLDLSKTGHIKPHIDSVKFCGSIIAGISLQSTSVMRLVMEKNTSIVVDTLLKRRSLYIMRGVVRYEFTHEILSCEASYFKSQHIPRERRVSVICRNEPMEKV
ncbi:hypothetical protein JTE90_004421 [Oedothorax gibbosus]|uniref:Alpha-ketoglutarate-dependent dioxygenase AlkB-like domain-containing protein n=1 Tax=Oedothorax gibbosus TaxID=931172 RepID=A0AAV6TRV9_9ARAC|nr:hypothetical protein JTE90_004421 [Oedothorax gibbosus]